MKKNLILIMTLLFLLMQLSCERDEICLEEITPKLIIRFYNENNPNEFKSVPLLKVNIEGIDGDYSNETVTTLTDSIAIPLEVANNKTRFILTLQGNDIEGTEDNLDTIAVIYTQQDIFISRACGYKTVFNEAGASLVTDDDNWIKGLETKNDPLQIIDENAAHVKIYH
ncbi:DUF6452 family protein [Lutimonas sp.]|uniref:DUF6452 family protein n=1 Tax=Lutimonas sp. TaxID=1872403 RepID=UPI003C7646AC